MDLVQVIVLSIIQGLTEFLPVSSSAHLLLPSTILGWKDQGVAFDVACHVGTLLAVIWYFRRDLRAMIWDCLAYSKNKTITPNVTLAWYLICGTIPVCVAGFFIDYFLIKHIRDYSIYVITGTTIVFGIVLYLADRYAKSHQNNISVQNMGFKKAFVIALSQILALFPGTSRSGISMTTALYLGLTREAASKYSFLLSIPIIIAAGTHATLKLIKNGSSLDLVYVVLGVLISFISAYIVIRLFMRWIEKIGMTPFVIYRLLLGCVLLAIIFLNFQ